MADQELQDLKARVRRARMHLQRAADFYETDVTEITVAGHRRLAGYLREYAAILDDTEAGIGMV
jgi:hypothetical protein